MRLRGEDHHRRRVLVGAIDVCAPWYMYGGFSDFVPAYSDACFSLNSPQRSSVDKGQVIIDPLCPCAREPHTKGSDVRQHLRASAQRPWHVLLKHPKIRRSGRQVYGKASTRQFNHHELLGTACALRIIIYWPRATTDRGARGQYRRRSPAIYSYIHIQAKGQAC